MSNPTRTRATAKPTGIATPLTPSKPVYTVAPPLRPGALDAFKHPSLMDGKRVPRTPPAAMTSSVQNPVRSPKV